MKTEELYELRAVYKVQFSEVPILVPTGHLDGDGRMMFTSKCEVHNPGSTFKVRDIYVVRRLLEAGAVELLSPGHEMLIEAAAEVLRRERGDDQPMARPRTEHWPQPAYPSQRWSEKNGTDDLI